MPRERQASDNELATRIGMIFLKLSEIIPELSMQKAAFCILLTAGNHEVSIDLEMIQDAEDLGGLIQMFAETILGPIRARELTGAEAT
jgi:hypothetical protein